MFVSAKPGDTPGEMTPQAGKQSGAPKPGGARAPRKGGYVAPKPGGPGQGENTPDENKGGGPTRPKKGGTG